jgi:hypothetical protein
MKYGNHENKTNKIIPEVLYAGHYATFQYTNYLIELNRCQFAVCQYTSCENASHAKHTSD